MPDLKVPKIEIKRYSLSLDPSIDVFNVVLENEGSSWNESFGSEAELLAFLRGVKAGCGMLGVYIPYSEIPREATAALREAIPESDMTSG